MPEITANVKVGLGIVAATAALITGLLGNVLAAHITAFFSGTPPKTGRRPAFLWVAFFVSAIISVVAGSVATFAPAAATTPATPTPPAQAPKIVVTNSNASMVRSDPKDQFFICRDTVQIANTSDLPTSVVGIGSELQVNGTPIQIAPTNVTTAWRNAQVAVQISVWKTGPPVKRYATIRTLDQFVSIRGEALPVRVEARSTSAVAVDYALKLTSGALQMITGTHTLRFPDIEDVKSESVQCK